MKQIMKSITRFNRSETSFGSKAPPTIVEPNWDYPNVRFQGSMDEIVEEYRLASSWIDSHSDYCLPDGTSFRKQVKTSLNNVEKYVIGKGLGVQNSNIHNIWTASLCPVSRANRLEYRLNHKNNPKNNAKVIIFHLRIPIFYKSNIIEIQSCQ
jgi:hypothetical protein